MFSELPFPITTLRFRFPAISQNLLLKVGEMVSKEIIFLMINVLDFNSLFH